MASPLEYSKLIRPEGVPRILSPNEIPIQPSVYNSSFAFTREYLAELVASLPESMATDIREIERILGITGLEITDQGIVYKDGDWTEALSYANINHYADPEKRTIGVDLGSSNIDILRHYQRELQLYNSHPMPKKKLGEIGRAHV